MAATEITTDYPAILTLSATQFASRPETFKRLVAIIVDEHEGTRACVTTEWGTFTGTLWRAEDDDFILLDDEAFELFDVQSIAI